MEKRIEIEKRGRSPAAIEELNLDNCRSTQIIGLTDEFCNLETLSLRNVGLITLEGFPKLPNLKKLELDVNQILGGLNWLHGSPKLTHLNLSDNNITDIDTLKPLEEFKNLKSLDLLDCEVTDVENYRDEVFGLISSLKYLDGYDRDNEEAEDSEVDDEDENDDDEDGDSEYGDSEYGDSEYEGSEYEDEEGQGLMFYRPLPATSNQSVQVCAEIHPDLQSLSEDFSRLLNEQINPDATLTCGGQTWRIHRAVLIVRSEVFAGMFRSGMTESETSTIMVEDLEATVLDSLLKYIYSGTVSTKNVPALYEAADKYAVLGLKKSCSDSMATTLSPKNCLDYLVLADAHSDVQLKEAAISFAIKHIAEIEKTIWTDFRTKNLHLAVEVLERFVPAMNE